MKPAVVLLAAALCFVLGCVAVSVAQSSDRSSKPPGVADENWVPISSNAGVVLTGPPRVRRSLSLGGVSIPAVERRSGVLMVHHDGRWLSFDVLGDTSPQLQPLLAK